MKKVQLILTTLFFFAFTTVSFGQLYIDAENNVAVGSDSTSVDAKMKILNSTENYGLKVVNNTSTSSIKYGLAAEVNEQGTGEKRGFFSTVRQSGSPYSAYGFYADIVNFGSSPSVGFYAGANTGTGFKTGINAALSQPSNSSSSVYGFLNSIYQNGTGEARGISTELTVYNTATGYGEFIGVSGNGSGPVNGLYADIYGSGSGNKVAIFARVPAGSGNKAANFYGDIYVDGTMVHSSDENLKENIKDLSNSLSLVEKIKPKKYKYKNLPNHGNNSKVEQYGFLAQELETVLPDLVQVVKHRGRTRPKNNNGNGNNGNNGNGNGNNPQNTEYEQLEPDEDVKTINYIGLIPILTQAIKEQQAVISQQSVLIEDLEKRVKKLEK